MTMQSTTVEIPPSPKLTKLSGDVAYFTTEVGKLVVTGDNLAQATELLGLMKAALAEIEEQRVWLTRPLNEHVKSINARARAIAEPIQVADQILRAKMTNFHVAERKRVEDERKRLEQEELDRLAAEAERIDAETPSDQPVEAPPAPAPAIVSAPPKTVRTDYGTSSIRDVWKWEVADAKQIPAEYFVLDDKKINAVVKAGVRAIPGIKIYKGSQLAVR